MTEFQMTVLDNIKVAMTEMNEKEQQELYLISKAFALLSTMRTKERFEESRSELK